MNVSLPPLTLALTCVMTLTACETTRTTETDQRPPVDTACHVYKPVYYSAKHDTPETIRQVRRNNAAYDALNCPRGVDPEDPSATVG